MRDLITRHRAVFSALVLAALGVALVWQFYFRVPPAPLVAVLTGTIATTTPTLKPAQFDYIEVIDSCNHDYVGTCLRMHSAPSTTSPVVARLRTGIVFKVAGTVETNGHTWYKVLFDKNIRYPERITDDWYIYGDAVRLFTDEGDVRAPSKAAAALLAPLTKRIVVDLSTETLYAYDGETLFMKEPISTGLEYTPTPKGTFTIFKKMPSRYMQGPLPGVSSQVYDLPGVPWNLYFTQDGAVIHGAYWHDSFGKPWSHGCVNLAPQTARKLYEWVDVGTPVTVQY